MPPHDARGADDGGDGDLPSSPPGLFPSVACFASRLHAGLALVDELGVSARVPASATTKPGFTFRAKLNFLGARPSGATEQYAATLEFRRTGAQEAKGLRVMSAREALRRVLVGWDLRNLTTGETVPFSADTLDDFCAIAGAPELSMDKYFGGREARR